MRKLTKILSSLFIAMLLIGTSNAYALRFDNSNGVKAIGNISKPSDWNGADKKLHFGYSIVIGGVATSVAKLNNWHAAVPIGLLSCTSVGLAKEIYDSRGGGSGFDHKDLAWDVAGCLVGTLTANTMINWIRVAPMSDGLYLGVKYPVN